MEREEFRYYALKLAGICVVVFIVQSLFSGFTGLFVLNQASWVQIWRFVSSIFLHGSLVHLVYNLFALVLFGLILEKFIGGKKFLVVFFVSGLVANLISVNFYSSALGASGAIFGIIGALIIIRPGMTVWAFSLPMHMAVAGVLWAIGDIMGIFMPGNVANIAHLVGMAAGLAFGVYCRKKRLINLGEKAVERRRGSRIEVDDKSIKIWEDIHMR
jgi:membrane associated rhomboid family serine protease